MANLKHEDILKKGVAAWNDWRDENPDAMPDLSTSSLSGADLTGANFRNANLSGAYLNGADLTDADLERAFISGSYFNETCLEGANLQGVALEHASPGWWNEDFSRATGLSPEMLTVIKALRRVERSRRNG